jgi:CheY-specific phosphatase CheX
MISQQAQEGLEFTMINALKDALAAPGEERCEVEIIEDTKGLKDKKMVILTVTSYMFRAMTLLYFTMNRQTKQHLARINRAEVNDMDETAFIDVICECGNIACGALNRELAQHFPHIGMSTPNILDNDSAGYLSALKPNYVRHFKVRVNDTLTMHATLCFCAFAEIDFAVDTTQTEESNGEMEMF